MYLSISELPWKHRSEKEEVGHGSVCVTAEGCHREAW